MSFFLSTIFRNVFNLIDLTELQVAAAHEQIKMEASVVADGLRLAGTYNRPYQETVPLMKKSSTKGNTQLLFLLHLNKNIF